jgi:Protein of unknown function (DUF4079)
MLASLALATATLRAGLRLRAARLRGARGLAAARRRHLRLAKLSVPMLFAGFLAGPASAVWLRGWDPFATLHSWIAIVAVLLFAATAWLGRQLEHGDVGRREIHGRLAIAALLAGAAALGTGFVLLP